MPRHKSQLIGGGLVFLLLSFGCGIVVNAATKNKKTSADKTHKDKSVTNKSTTNKSVTNKSTTSKSTTDKGKREIVLSVGMGVGGARVPSLGWFRSDYSLSVDLGVALHPNAQLRVAFITSMERFFAMVSFGGAWVPLKKKPWGTPCLRGAIDVVMAGAGVQPGLTGALGYAWWSPWPVGLFVESRFSGRLTQPRVFEAVGTAGVFVYF